MHGYATWNLTGQLKFHFKFVYKESLKDYLTASKRIDLCIENFNCNPGLSAAPFEIWIRRDVFFIPDKRNCIIVWCKPWKTSKQQKLRISGDTAAQKCRTLSQAAESSVQWNKVGKQTSESHLIFHLGMELETTSPNGYRRAGRYPRAVTWAAHRVLCSWAP